MRLRIVNLCKSYSGRMVVKDLNMELEPGEIVGLLGPNGAGKTTTFRMIVGFLHVDRGQIFLDSRELSDMPVYKRAQLGLGYLSQEPSVFRKLTVGQNIIAVLEMLGKSRDEQRDMKEELLRKLNITHLEMSKGYTLSGGERRRVELARALATRPVFLLLDEPFTGIDPIVRAEIQDIIRRLKQEGIGILITDHNVRETLEITDRAYLMYDARILVSGTSEELINDPEAKRLYLGHKFRM